MLNASKDGNLRTFWQLETSGAGGNRIDFSHVSGAMSIGLNGSSFTFTGAPTIEGDVEHTVDDESLNGDFPITFVDAENLPVNRATVLQFMTGPALESYMKLWDIVQNGGPMGML